MPYKKIIGIYCIENKINNKKYIGQSVDIKNRWSKHKNELESNIHHNQYLQQSWNKYGKENFKFYIIIECSKSELNELEICYIKKFDSINKKYGYNLTKGGDKKVQFTYDVLEKISNSSSKFPVLQFTLDGILVNQYKNCNVAAKELNLESKRLYQCCQNNERYKTAYGYIWIYEHNYKIYEFSVENYKKKSTSKPVSQYDLQNNYIATYKSAREAEKETGIGYKMISRVCNGGRPYTHGYIFKFTE